MSFRISIFIFAAALVSCSASAPRSIRGEIVDEFSKDEEVVNFLDCVTKNYRVSMKKCQIDRSKINFVGKREITPLAWLAIEGFITPESFAEMWRKGADLNSEYGALSTPGGYVIRIYPAKFLYAVVNAGAPINACQYARSDDTCMIFSAITSRELDKVSFLVNRGADLEIIDGMFDETAILYSLTRNDYLIANYLLESGANLKAVTKGTNQGICWHVEHAKALLIEGSPIDDEAAASDKRVRNEIAIFLNNLEKRGVHCGAPSSRTILENFESVIREDRPRWP